MPQENMPIDLVAEAERIIQGYVRKKQALTSAPKAAPRKRKKPKPRLDFVINTTLLCSCMVLLGLLYYLVLHQ